VVKSRIDQVDTLSVGATTLEVEGPLKSIFLTKGQNMKAKSGFTLVEILIVVVILGILAAIVIPQFTEASTEAKTSSLCTDLQSVRSQIELYKIQHNDNLPGVTATGHGTDVDFAGALTGMTNQAGVKQTTAGDGVYGPYLQKMPSNPFVSGDDANDVTAGTAVAPTGADGWYFNTTSGDFNANDSADHWKL
jgi:general secretion pathway protein G